MTAHVVVWRNGTPRFFPRLPSRMVNLGLVVDRISGTAPNIGNVVLQHDLDIPEGYVAEIWGCEIHSNGFLDTGGILRYFVSLDDDVVGETVAVNSDDVIFSGQFETLLVTTGAAMVVGRDRAFFPHPFVTARDIINWILASGTNWSASTVTCAIFYVLRKSTAKDIANLLLRNR